MTGSKDRFDDGELDQLAQDLDLDMDAPIGQTFAAALRDKGGALPPLEDEFSLDDDGFTSPPPKSAPAHDPAVSIFEDEDLAPPSGEAGMTFDDADEFSSQSESFSASSNTFDEPAAPAPAHSAWL